MDQQEAEQQRLIATEFERLKLRASERPGGGLAVAGGPDGVARFLAHLRGLKPGATWHDVFPGMPKHWVAGKPETWTHPYRPLGPYDYQELPTGPAIHVIHESAPTDWEWLASLVVEARVAGWPVFGAGPAASGNRSHLGHAYIVLGRGTDQDVTWAVAEWLNSRPNLELAGVPRTGDEEYLS
jgi:hypothetical protein